MIDLGDSVEWVTKRQGLVVTAKGIKDFPRGYSKYDFTLEIPRRECALILQTLADAILKKDQPAQ